VSQPWEYREPDRRGARHDQPGVRPMFRTDRPAAPQPPAQAHRQAQFQPVRQPQPTRQPEGQAPAVPPQFGPAAPPRQDGTHGYGQPSAPWQQDPPRPLFEPARPQYRPLQAPPPQSAPAYRPPATWSRPPRARAASRRRLPPYPWHKVRFPWKALPRSRRRGASLWRVLYLGTHPVAMLIELCITMVALEVIAAWVALVVAVWALQVACVTVGWLCEGATARR
jgi:hypothetical protein